MRKAFVFDFDDTLATTDCLVIVRDSANSDILFRLTPEEFNDFRLPANCHYDFSEFRDGSFIRNASPTWLIYLAKEVYNEGHDIFVLTARDNHVQYEITTWLWGHNINTAECFCVGGTGDEIAENKRQVLLDIVNRYDKTYFYDDSEANVNIYQHEKLRSYLVKNSEIPH